MTAYLKETIKQANRLQNRYLVLQVAGTQFVRNDKPMRQLVLEALPVRSAPKHGRDFRNLLSPEEIFQKIFETGRRVTMQQVLSALAQLRSFKLVSCVPVRFDPNKSIGYSSHFLYYRLK